MIIMIYDIKEMMMIMITGPFGQLGLWAPS
jgi:hypothetical protein